MSQVNISIMALFLFCFLSADLCAADKKSDCDNAANTIQINQCLAKDFEKIDAKLNTVYKNVMKDLSKSSSGAYIDAKKELIRAQRLWVKFREQDCSAVYTSYREGSIRGAMFLGCKMARTKQRIIELQEWLKKN